MVAGDDQHVGLLSRTVCDRNAVDVLLLEQAPALRGRGNQALVGAFHAVGDVPGGNHRVGPQHGLTGPDAAVLGKRDPRQRVDGLHHRRIDLTRGNLVQPPERLAGDPVMLVGRVHQLNPFGPCGRKQTQQQKQSDRNAQNALVHQPAGNAIPHCTLPKKVGLSSETGQPIRRFRDVPANGYARFREETKNVPVRAGENVSPPCSPEPPQGRESYWRRCRCGCSS